MKRLYNVLYTGNIFIVITAFAPLGLRLWRLFNCGAACGTDSFLGLFSDTLVGSAFLVLALACPRLLRLVLVLLWGLFQVGSQELFQAMRRYPVWQDLHYLFDADFVHNSAGSFRLASPAFTIVMCAAALVTAFVQLPRLRMRHLACSVPVLVVLFFVHAQLEAGSSHAVTANRNPLHSFVLDAAYGGQRSGSNATVIALPASLKQADISGNSLLGGARGKAKNVLIIVIEGIPGLYIPEIRQVMGVSDNPLSMHKLTEATKSAMLVPDFAVHSHQTIRGLYSILCGDFSKLSWDTPKAFELLNRPERAAACLPAQLAQHGFTTHYLQAAGLSFMLKDRVMARTGFNEVHGTEWFEAKNITNPFPFEWGVVDTTFFQGAHRYIRELRKNEQPWMLTLLTVGTHHPFGIPPEMAAEYPSLQDASVAYLDTAVAQFINSLKTDGVLDDTLVIVTSDESHGSPRWDWVSSWGLNIVLAPEQNALPRIKSGSYGLVDMETSILDYLNLPVPAPVIGRSIFRDYSTPRELLSFTNMVLRRHNGSTNIRCAGGHTCAGGKTSSLIAQQLEKMQELPQHVSEETYTIASSLDSALQFLNDVQQFSFASGEVRKIEQADSNNAGSGIIEGGHNLYIPENSDVTINLKITLLDAPKTDVPFRLLAQGDRFLYSYMVDAVPLPKFPDLQPLHIGESLEEEFSFHTAQKIERLTFNLQADINACSVRVDKFDVTVRKGLPQNELDGNGSPHPLETAARLDDIARARSIIAGGSNVNTPNKLGITALMWAAFEGHKDMVEMLIAEGADINASSNKSETALSIALKSEHHDIAELLINNGANPSAALLPVSWWGVRTIPNVNFLLEHGADINHVGGISTKWTPLMHAANRGDESLVLFLLDKGADLNFVTDEGETALYVALNKKHNGIATILLNKGANKNVALMPASWRGDVASSVFLLQHGANINYMGGIGGVKWTPLMHAAYHGHKELTISLLKNGANLDTLTNGMETALSLALKQNKEDVAEILLDKGANPNVALLPASWRGDLDAAAFLLEHGADINFAGGIGNSWTPLMHAAFHGHRGLVIFLLDKGANVNAHDATGLTALSLATRSGHTDIVNILQASVGK